MASEQTDRSVGERATAGAERPARASRTRGTFILEASRASDLPPEALWAVMADLNGYGEHVQRLVSTVVVAGARQGARRRCTAAEGDIWEETCVLWEPGRRFVMAVDTATYPRRYRLVFRTFTGTWLVAPGPAGGSRMTIRFEAGVRGGIAGRALARLLSTGARAELEAILTSYERPAQRTGAPSR